MRELHEMEQINIKKTDRTTGPCCLVDLFEHQRSACPDRPALIFASTSFSYRELGEKADAMARVLRAMGIGRGSHVGLFVERSAQAYVALLAILKSGAAYVPMDAEYPAGRVGDIARDAALALLLTDRALEARAREAWDGPIFVFDAPMADAALPLRLPAGVVEDQPVGADDLCYIIYTSGSTGRPKGVMLEHRNVVHYIRSASAVYGINAEDRVYQGFSLAFDASVEELWLAWANGGALVGGTKAAVHCPLSVAALLQSQRVTVFSSVPTFLSLIEHPLPSVRLLIVGGEVCPAELVARFAPGRRMLNTYGPTEAAVVTTAADCRAGEPVTIGRALPGYRTLVVDDDLKPLPQGVEGELLIGGPGVARGYLGRPEMTAERFVSHPACGEGRCYRSGDRVRQNANGEIEFVGRADGQVKIRGFRVELTEIESALLEQPGIRAAAVKVHTADGVPAIAAFVVPRGDQGELDRALLAAALRARLADYMVPRYLDVVAQLPMLPSGKIDRATLPAPKALLRVRSSVARRAMTPTETRIVAVWEEVLGEKGFAADAHLFDDLGGHSLLAAQIASNLRRDPAFQALSVKDLYDHPSVAALARQLESQPSQEPTGEPYRPPTPAREAPPSTLGRAWVYFLQLCTFWFTACMWTTPAVVALVALNRLNEGDLSFARYVALLGGIFLVTPPALLLLSILSKWLLIGRYRRGSYPLWGSTYLRWWIVNRLQAVCGVELLAGTPLMNWYCRLMGARVGRGAVINTSLVSCFDLLTLGEDSSIGAETSLLGYRVENGRILFGKVQIGRGCFVGIHSCLGLDTLMEDASRLDDLSCLHDGERISRAQGRRGSPVQPADVRVPGATLAPRRPALFGAVFTLAVYAFYAVLAMISAPVLVVSVWAYEKAGWTGLFVAVPLAALISVLSFCLMTVLLKWLLLGRTRPGIYRVDSLFFVRKWFLDRLMNLSRTMLLPLYATLYTPIWMRALGAKLGRRCEVSTVSSITPDMLSAGDECFFADGAVVGGIRLHQGWAQIGVNEVGSRTFIGNSAVLPTGVTIGSESLLGCLSTLPVGTPARPSGSKWLGSPPFALPNLQPTAEFALEQIYEPTRKMVLARLAVDALRILIPTSLNVLTLTAFSFFLYWLNGSFAAKCLLAPLGYIALSLGSALCVIALKWAIMGRFKPVIRPLWSPYVWFNELVNGAYEATLSPALSPLLGTPFIAPFLRLIGIRMGRRVYVGSLLFSEFDLVSIGDDAALNVGATIQTHLFENRIIKSSYLKIGEHCTVGNMSVVLYDTSMADCSRLGPLSLLMKGETLPRRGLWAGIPCREVVRRRPHAGQQVARAPRPLGARVGGGAQIIRKRYGKTPPQRIPSVAHPQLNFQSNRPLEGGSPDL